MLKFANQTTKHIYVIQMHTGSVPGRVIKFLTRYEYSHVALSLDKNCKTTFSFGRKSLNNFLKGGFVAEYQKGAFFRKFSKTLCRIYEIEVTDKQYEFLEKLIEHRVLHENEYKYDFAGIVLRFFRIPVAFSRRAVCSQFVAEMLEEGGVIHFEKPCYFVKPKDFDGFREFKTIYEGLYSQYKLV